MYFLGKIQSSVAMFSDLGHVSPSPLRSLLKFDKGVVQLMELSDLGLKKPNCLEAMGVNISYSLYKGNIRQSFFESVMK